ncbi:hypothetical protein CSB37_03275 [bacterium DOLZORAL124_38_8]|nr:MAG: hypothetical protein CSB37_03275 [bacterium DOLZORAL124_38_8]
MIIEQKNFCAKERKNDIFTIMIERTCRVSGEKFIIAKEDLEFYAKMGVITAEQLDKLASLRVGESARISESNVPQELLIGLPTLCPEERQRRRLSWRNEWKLYKRKCDGTGKTIVSQYSPDKNFKVYERSYWLSEKWDPYQYSLNFDFNKPFFEQFETLMHLVPQASLSNGLLEENCGYCNYGIRNKNGYLSYACGYCEDFYYCHTCGMSNNLVDCLRTDYSELCYECIDCQSCFNLFYSKNCHQCRDSFFLESCRSCEHCFDCINLFHKKYYIQNKPVSKEHYEKFIKNYKEKNSVKNVSIYQKMSRDKNQESYFRASRNLKCENVCGDFLQESKNIVNSFDVLKSCDVKNCIGALGVRDAMDIAFSTDSELVYESLAFSGYNIIGGVLLGINKLRNIFYSIGVQSGHDVFGCIGLKNAQYCILNKQYSKEEYEELLPKIIAHMKKTGEWGEFFPVNMSPFAYNETVAQEYYPLTKEKAEKRGYKWKEEPINKKYETLKQSFDWNQIPDDIQEVGDDILTKVLFCERSGKPYQIQKAELRFYRKMNLPIPHLHPDERHKDRMKLRNPRKLYQRTCADCQKAIQTTFAPDRPEKILCEECYLKVVD